MSAVSSFSPFPRSSCASLFHHGDTFVHSLSLSLSLFLCVSLMIYYFSYYHDVLLLLGALFEYLKLVGHPQQNIQTEPKYAVMKMWRENGFTVKAPGAFTPHYIQRHVLTRHDTDQVQ